ncbi:MAG TPA: serine/threonine-protein kinase [Kofleriaceae bacterium]|jgi:serine/threonine-protein kinase
MFVCSECGLSSPSPGGCPADGTQFVPIGEDLLLGQTVGAYRVARLLGVGGMGRVYKAVHPSIGSRVAVKVLSRECSDRRDLVERFFAEARAVNLIRHESIVNVLDLSMLPDGRPYIIMEYLDGAPLATIVEMANTRGSRLPIGGTARVCGEVLEALQAAHDKHVIHRDLKPDNIFIAPSGRPKVLDFGIAKLSDGGVSSSTKTGSLLGTPHYMSPEQASGRPIDHRTDVYAMGVILYECLTGQKPFVAEALFDLLRKHVEAPPPSARVLRPDLPVEVDQVILCALAKSPDQRFNSARAMSQALQNATQSLPAHEWTPVTGGLDLATTLPRAWDQTPGSWGNKSSPSGAPLDPSTGPPQPRIGHATPTPGQMPNVRDLAPQSKASKAGLFFALGAIALVVGGIAIAMIMTSGKHDGTTETAKVADKTEPAHDASDTKAAGGTIAPVAPVAPVAKTDDDDDKDDDDADLAQLDQLGGDLGKQQNAAIDNAIDQAVSAMRKQKLPPEAKKLVDELEAAKKLPVSKKIKALQTFANNMSGAMMAGAGTQIAEADDQQAAPDDPSKRGWFSRHTITPPNFDAKHTDASKITAWAIAEAKRNVPDAQFTRLDVENVSSKGVIDFTLPYNGGGRTSLMLRFVSPSWKKRSPSTLPKGVSGTKKECQFYIVIDANEAEIYDVSSDCKDDVIAPPTCSFAQVWQKVLAKKPELADYVGSMGFWGNDGKGRWYVGVKDDDKSLFGEWVADDCK